MGGDGGGNQEFSGSGLLKKAREELDKAKNKPAESPWVQKAGEKTLPGKITGTPEKDAQRSGAR